MEQQRVRTPIDLGHRQSRPLVVDDFGQAIDLRLLEIRVRPVGSLGEHRGEEDDPRSRRHESEDASYGLTVHTRHLVIQDHESGVMFVRDL